ncbi:MAG: serine/threonine-protein kinase [bacterium]|nr:serine/threonine-protein kinase [bacterium]
MATPPNKLKSRSRLGKYRIECMLAEGGFARVYRALDTIEGIKVALKVPHQNVMTPKALEFFRKEARLSAGLDHPNILPVKNAAIVDGRFVIALPLGEQSLNDRLRTRLSIKTALSYAEQILEGLAAAHAHNIVHCDIKPENILIFPENRIRITDFGIARVARKTMQVSGSGTLGYMPPEQAMGRASFASDVFSAGLVLWRMFSGQLPEWPFRQPLAGHDRLRKLLRPAFVEWLSRAIDPEPNHRYKDAAQMLRAFQRIKSRALRTPGARQRKKRASKNGDDLRKLRLKLFLREHGRKLQARHECSACHGPISEQMQGCPWCGKSQKKFKGETKFPYQCPRCCRGMKADWRFCPWCYGAAVGEKSEREFSDVRYVARCTNRGCGRKDLMQYMRYCPWCNRKVQKQWKIVDHPERCPSCKWGVLKAYWSHCPWCKTGLHKTKN